MFTFQMKEYMVQYGLTQFSSLLSLKKAFPKQIGQTQKCTVVSYKTRLFFLVPVDILEIWGFQTENRKIPLTVPLKLPSQEQK